MERDQHGHYSCLQFLDDPSASPTGSVVCKGAREMLEAVAQRYSAFQDLYRGTPWDTIYVIRDGVELGSIGDVRERFTLWNMQVGLWASKNNIILGSRRMNKKEGSYPLFPNVVWR